MHVLAVVVVPGVDEHLADAEEVAKSLEAPDASRTLRHDELVGHLIAGDVAGPARPPRLPDEADGEAPFSVYETRDPADPDQPFLLVFCTDRIVTAHDKQSRASTGRILRFSSI